MKTVLDVLDKALSIIENVLIILLMLVALALGIVQVVMRYVFNSGIGGLEMYFILATSAAMLLAGSRAVRDDKHVRVELLSLMVSRRGQNVLQVVSNVLGLALTSFLFYACITYTEFAHMMETVSLETGLPDWQISLIATVTLGMFALRYVIRLIRSLMGDDIPLHGLPEVSVTEAEGMV